MMRMSPQFEHIGQSSLCRMIYSREDFTPETSSMIDVVFMSKASTTDLLKAPNPVSLIFIIEKLKLASQI